MKRMLLTTTMSAMFAVAAPGVASAHQGERHRGAHHADTHRHRHHHHHHAAPARVRIFGTPRAPVSSTPPSTPPVTPPGRKDEPAATVASFAGGVLTITLKDGSTVGGKVTDRTEIHCQSATTPPTGEDGDRHGDRSGDEDGNSSGRDDRNDGSRDDNGGGDAHANEQSCTAAALVAGAVVREAKLIVLASGAIWVDVDLIR